MKRFARCALLLGALVASLCWAGPREDVDAAIAKFMSARSYRADLTASSPRPMKSRLDYVAPDRYRMHMDGVGEQTIVGHTMYMTMPGRTIRLPIPAGTVTRWRDPARLVENSHRMTVTALGSEAVGGTPAKKYRVDHTQPRPSSMTLWIGRDGYPLQIVTGAGAKGETAATTIRYSRFNDPAIRVAAP